MSAEERLAKLAGLATEVAFLRPARVYLGVICTHIHLTGRIDADAANICNHIKEKP